MRREARAALNRLYSISPSTRHVGESARAALVFPNIVAAGPNSEAQRGSGTLLVDGRAVGYYKLAAASYNLPKGVQKFGCVLFFMADNDLAQLRNSGVWEIGTGPKVVVTEENSKRKGQGAASASASANEVVTIAPSAATIVAHASQVTHRPAMNDQQEPAPRPNGLTLDPKYRGFIPILNTGLTRTLTATTQRDGVYAFAFCRKELIDGLRLQGAKIAPIHPD
jgi:hypothetical protein